MRVPSPGSRSAARPHYYFPARASGSQLGNRPAAATMPPASAQPSQGHDVAGTPTSPRSEAAVDVGDIAVTGSYCQVCDTLADIAAFHAAIRGRRVLYVVDSPWGNVKVVFDEVSARIPDELIEDRRPGLIYTELGGRVQIATTRGHDQVRGATFDTLIFDMDSVPARLREDVVPCLNGSQHEDGTAIYRGVRQ